MQVDVENGRRIRVGGPHQVRLPDLLEYRAGFHAPTLAPRGRSRPVTMAAPIVKLYLIVELPRCRRWTLPSSPPFTTRWSSPRPVPSGRPRVVSTRQPRPYRSRSAG